MHAPDNPGPADPSPEAREAARAWVMVQSARLCRPASPAHDAAIRPEHADALNDFLQILHPSMDLPLSLRTHLMVAFDHQVSQGRIPPQVDALVATLGIGTLAEQGYRLDGHTGDFAPAAEQALSRVLNLSSTPRSRVGKLPDSEQYRYIKSMTPGERTSLEDSLASLFMNQAGPASLEGARRALDTWLTVQQVRLRVHSEASLQRHAQAMRSPVTGLRMAAAVLGAAPWPHELSRFHSEHECSDRPEYATALGNFLRLLQHSSPLHPDLKHHVAARLTQHAEIEGTLSAPVVEALRQRGPYALADASWRLDPVNNIFAPPVVAIAPQECVYWWAIPTPHTPSPTGSGLPGPGLGR